MGNSILIRSSSDSSLLWKPEIFILFWDTCKLKHTFFRFVLRIRLWAIDNWKRLINKKYKIPMWDINALDRCIRKYQVCNGFILNHALTNKNKKNSPQLFEHFWHAKNRCEVEKKIQSVGHFYLIVNFSKEF